MHAERQGEIRRPLTGDGLVIQGPHGERQLGAVLRAIWQAADGRTSIAGLVAAARQADATADEALVWQGLDSLADAGLLKTRIAPPGAVIDRRALFLGMAAAAAALLASGRSRAADAPAVDAKKESLNKAAGGDQEQNDKLRGKESAKKSTVAKDQAAAGPGKANEQSKKGLRDAEATVDPAPDAASRESDQKTSVRRNQEQNDKRKQEQNDKLKPTP